MATKPPSTPRYIYDGKGQFAGRISRTSGKDFVYDKQGKLQYKIDAPKEDKKKR
jgi:hypothetical protein